MSSEKELQRVAFERIVRKVIADLEPRNLWTVSNPQENNETVLGFWDSNGEKKTFTYDTHLSAEETESSLREWLVSIGVTPGGT